MHWIVLLAMIVVAGCAIVYVLYVTHHITIANAMLDKAAIVSVAEGPWAWVKAKLLGWKTIILSWIALVVQIPQHLDLELMKDLPWLQVFDAKIAGWITIVCAVLIPLTHASGQQTAAQVPPNPNGSA